MRSKSFVLPKPSGERRCSPSSTEVRQRQVGKAATANRFGVLMRSDNPPALKTEIRIAELAGVPLMISRASQSYWENIVESRSMNIIGTYKLIFNASLLVESGACCALGFETLINTMSDSVLCFRPLAGQKKTAGVLIWKKYQTSSPAVQLFIDLIRANHKHQCLMYP